MLLRLFILNYRVAHFFTKNSFLKIIGIPVRILFKIFNIVMSIDISEKTIIGKNFRIDHGQGLVINHNTLIGNNVIVRQNTTIGNKGNGSSKCPKIEDNVNIGANTVIIGEIVIGKNAIIGAGSVVTKDVPQSVIVAGNPAKVIREINK